MACIRARWLAAWELAQGKSGPDGKYWTSSCMYRPEGKVIPAYSTWQPTDGKIVPIAKADQSATRRLVDPRGELIWGNPIASTLLGVSGGFSNSFPRENQTAVGSPFLLKGIGRIDRFGPMIPRDSKKCVLPIASNAREKLSSPLGLSVHSILRPTMRSRESDRSDRSIGHSG
jgi:hypothetical protein